MKVNCEECQDTGEVNGNGCRGCCPHSELDHGICMDCEVDLSDQLASQAYDRYKDWVKYGD